MLIYRIMLAKYAGKLLASGRAARWNPNDIDMIYAASSRALACLENAVHRDQVGLKQLFSIMTINCPDDLAMKIIYLDELPRGWSDYDKMFATQRIGERWIRENKTVLLQVPSSIIEEEVNYLLNPKHPDFSKIKVVKTQPFIFDSRIKQ
jgi:RES domain-containing protein